MSAPTISVIMPAYNGSAMIGETLASVFAQSFTDFEVIVVDDLSKDDTLAVLATIADPRLRVIASPVNGGPVVARSHAFSHARGRYIVGLDQDDLCHPDRFATQLSYLEAHPEVVLVASAADFLEAGVISPPRDPLHTSPVLIDWLLQVSNPIVWSSVMFRADAARGWSPFQRLERQMAEDFDLYHRLAQHGVIARIDTPLVTYRIHPGGASKVFTDRMVESASRVLAGPYERIFGAEAQDAARLVMRHFASGNPVSDAASLARLAGIVARVHEDFLATRRPDAGAQEAIMAEYARAWWRVAQASVRSGQLSLPSAVSARPEGLALTPRAVVRTGTSAVIGTYRAMTSRRRSA